MRLNGLDAQKTAGKLAEQPSDDAEHCHDLALDIVFWMTTCGLS
jgi:hypothetical protein